MPLLALSFVLLLAGDWPQFLGPTRNGVSPETVHWPPTVLWHKDAGEGFAAPVVANGKVVFFYRQNGKEIVDCLDANTGAKIWSYDYPTTYRDDFGFDEGPRSAPAIADGAVFTFGAQGVLSAVDFATGKETMERATPERRKAGSAQPARLWSKAEKCWSTSEASSPTT